MKFDFMRCLQYKVYLIPNTISDESNTEILPTVIGPSVGHVRFFAVEDQKAARKLLKRIPQFPLDQCTLLDLNEHTSHEQIPGIFEQAGNQDIGIISEAGCPCVADPGSELVLLAHQKKWEVVPLVGPSAILLALMASGLNGQNFVFHGYLPREQPLRIKKLKSLEHSSLSEGQTQIIMETPYRNESLFQDILAICHPETFLCVACDLTGPSQLIKTLPIHQWQKTKVSLHKKPAVFLILEKIAYQR